MKLITLSPSLGRNYEKSTLHEFLKINLDYVRPGSLFQYLHTLNQFEDHPPTLWVTLIPKMDPLELGYLADSGSGISLITLGSG